MVHVAYGDAVGGLNGAAALLTALRHRRRTGEGQYLDLSQSEGLFPLGIHGILHQLGNRSRAGPHRQSVRRTCAPHGVYPARGEDQWVVIQVLTEEQWGALAGVVKGSSRSARIDGSAGAARRTRSRRRRVDAHACAARDHARSCRPAACPAAARPQRARRHRRSTTRRTPAMADASTRAYVGRQPNPVAPYRVGQAPNADRSAGTDAGPAQPSACWWNCSV